MLKYLLYLSLLFAPCVTMGYGVAVSDDAQQIQQALDVASDISDSQPSDTDEQDGVSAHLARLAINMVQSSELSYVRLFLPFSNQTLYFIRAPPFFS